MNPITRFLKELQNYRGQHNPPLQQLTILDSCGLIQRQGYGMEVIYGGSDLDCDSGDEKTREAT